MYISKQLIAASVMLLCALMVLVGNRTIADTQHLGLSSHEVMSIVARPLNDPSQGYYLAWSQFNNLDISYINLNHSILYFADFTQTKGQECSLRNVKGTYIQLVGAQFFSCDFSNSDFTYSMIIDSSFGFSDFSNALFGDANLTNSNFSNVNLTNANFGSANLTNVDFADAILAGVMLPDGTIYQEGDDLVQRFGAKSNP